MKQSPVKVCPVPTEQQPLNEYEQLKDSWPYHWATLDTFSYGRKLFWVWVLGWILTGPIAADSFSLHKFPIHFAIFAGLLSVIPVALILIQLYLSWSYVGDRLRKTTVSYEESGWYDGKTWEKTPEVQSRDRLVVFYQIEPILKRLRQTSQILIILIASNCLIWLTVL